MSDATNNPANIDGMGLFRIMVFWTAERGHPGRAGYCRGSRMTV